MQTFNFKPSSPLVEELTGAVMRHHADGVPIETLIYDVIHVMAAMMAFFPLETEVDYRNEARFLKLIDENLVQLSRGYREAARTLRQPSAGKA